MTVPASPELEAPFHEALARPPDGRAAFLAERCGGRPDVQAQIEALLRAHDEAASGLSVAALGAPSALRASTRLGAYEILGKLGAGGMGEVYRARDSRLRRDVAIKILPAAFTADADRLARFEREARVLAALNHPNMAGADEVAVIHPAGSSLRFAARTRRVNGVDWPYARPTTA